MVKASRYFIASHISIDGGQKGLNLPRDHPNKHLIHQTSSRFSWELFSNLTSNKFVSGHRVSTTIKIILRSLLHLISTKTFDLRLCSTSTHWTRASRLESMLKTLFVTDAIIQVCSTLQPSRILGIRQVVYSGRLGQGVDQCSRWKPTHLTCFFPMDICFYLASWYYTNGLRMSVSRCSQILDGLVSSHPDQHGWPSISRLRSAALNTRILIFLFYRTSGLNKRGTGYDVPNYA